MVVKLPPVGRATPPADAVTGWPVNVPLKIDRPMGLGVGVTVLLPMTISGTRFFFGVSLSFSSSFWVFGWVRGYGSDRHMACDSEMFMHKERLM